MSRYNICAACIKNGLYKDKDDMQFKLDTFWVAKKLSNEEYQELTQMLADK